MEIGISSNFYCWVLLCFLLTLQLRQFKHIICLIKDVGRTEYLVNFGRDKGIQNPA